MKLLNASRQTLVPKLEVADTLWTRMRGLLGRSQLPPDEALWIRASGSVHTFFMKFAIDLVFVNHDLVVTKIVSNVHPFRFVWKGWSANSVIELQAGFLEKNPIRVGDKLHVDPQVP